MQGLEKKVVNKKGQLTIFVIVAIVIVALGVLVYNFFPEIKTTLGFAVNNPGSFMQECMDEELGNSVKMISSQGGSLDPVHYYLYLDEKIGYLCYTNEDYLTCVVQQPLLKQHIENEIKNAIKNKEDSCFAELRNSFQGQGYSVDLKEGNTSVELLPKRVVVTFNRQLTLTKEDSETYEKLDVVLNNNLYELMSVANSIINMEVQFGDSETTVYMNYYHNLKVEKLKQGDGTKVYILTNRDTGNKFQFATRSKVFPAGI
ncbi:MAG: hypothetical protein HY361_00665 [Candidatus Aenigmarchaeota archaeon]|nr:hypothetical protein [Candidatus Aenigmarchaeota archaeon]